jgi:hypothetical protein
MVATERKEATKEERIVTVNRMPKNRSRTKKYKNKNRNCTYKKRIRGGVGEGRIIRSLGKVIMSPDFQRRSRPLLPYLGREIQYKYGQYAPLVAKGLANFKITGEEIAKDLPKKIGEGVVKGVLKGNSYFENFALNKDESEEMIKNPRKEAIGKLFNRLKSDNKFQPVQSNYNVI